MKKNISIIFSAFFAVFFAACGALVYTDGYASQKEQGDTSTLGLDREDFEETAQIMIDSMLSDPAFANIQPGQRKVIAIGKIINDIPQRIDTDKLISKITIALRKSGKFVLITAVAAGGARDEMSGAVRELRDNDELNQNTTSSKGTLVAPDFSISGKIRQDSVKLKNGDIQAGCFFYLSVMDLNSGFAYWEDERTIDKIGSSKSVTW